MVIDLLPDLLFMERARYCFATVVSNIYFFTTFTYLKDFAIETYLSNRESHHQVEGEKA